MYITHADKHANTNRVWIEKSHIRPWYVPHVHTARARSRNNKIGSRVPIDKLMKEREREKGEGGRERGEKKKAN